MKTLPNDNDIFLMLFLSNYPTLFTALPGIIRAMVKGLVFSGLLYVDDGYVRATKNGKSTLRHLMYLYRDLSIPFSPATFVVRLVGVPCRLSFSSYRTANGVKWHLFNLDLNDSVCGRRVVSSGCIPRSRVLVEDRCQICDRFWPEDLPAIRS